MPNSIVRNKLFIRYNKSHKDTKFTPTTNYTLIPPITCAHLKSDDYSVQFSLATTIAFITGICHSCNYYSRNYSQIALEFMSLPILHNRTMTFVLKSEHNLGSYWTRSVYHLEKLDLIFLGREEGLWS